MNAATEFSNALTAAVEKASAGTVLVDARRRYPASGIAFAADLVLTADHVVTREDQLMIRTGAGRDFPASIAGRDPGTDLALLRIGDQQLTAAQIAPAPAKVGQLVLALGRPNAMGIQASWGIVTAVGGPTRTGRGGLLDQYFQTETTPYPGFSGGPLVDTDGQVLGLNTSGLTPGSSLTIPSGVAWKIGEALSKDGTVKRGYLGVRTQGVELGAAAQEELKSGQDRGLLIVWLEEGGPAVRGGLLVGDIVVGISGKPVGDPDDIFAALGRDTIGQPVDVQVLRGGHAQTLRVSVGERK